MILSWKPLVLKQSINSDKRNWKLASENTGMFIMKDGNKGIVATYYKLIAPASNLGSASKAFCLLKSTAIIL